jgi:hypothetical protein
MTGFHVEFTHADLSPPQPNLSNSAYYGSSGATGVPIWVKFLLGYFTNLCQSSSTVVSLAEIRPNGRNPQYALREALI